MEKHRRCLLNFPTFSKVFWILKGFTHRPFLGLLAKWPVVLPHPTVLALRRRATSIWWKPGVRVVWVMDYYFYVVKPYMYVYISNVTSCTYINCMCGNTQFIRHLQSEKKSVDGWSGWKKKSVDGWSGWLISKFRNNLDSLEFPISWN